MQNLENTHGKKIGNTDCTGVGKPCTSDDQCFGNNGTDYCVKDQGSDTGECKPRM